MNLWTAALGNNPLIHALRIHNLNTQLETQLAEIAKDTNSQPIVNSRATAAGDSRKLRGIPTIARGVTGTSPGTDPLAVVLEQERRKSAA